MSLITIIIIAAAVLLIIVMLFLMIKTANANEALAVSGVGATDKNGNPTIKRAGGRIVIPFIQKAKYFDLCVRTAKVEGDVTKTIYGVPISIDWAVAYSPDITSDESLQKAVCNFLDKDARDLEAVILDIVSGGVRAVISRMTPEEVMNGKDQLDDNVKKPISTQMHDLGFNAILSIHEVEDADNSTYFHDLAAKDRETKRREAANITAENDQQIRETKAETNRVAQEKELAAQVVVAERQRDTDVKKAQFDAETARERAKSEMAGELERTDITQELEKKKGAVAVMQAEQANLAAKKQQEVEVTRAETSKRTTIIAAEGEAERKKAEAAGEAEAAAISAKGKTEAEAIAAKGKAEAEAARMLSDAQAANDKVNFELRRIEIEQNTRVQVATNVATAMAEVGKNARFYDFGGGAKSESSGDLLTSVLSRIPMIFAQADLENQALNGEQLTDTIWQLVASVADGIKNGQPSDSTPTGEGPDDASPDLEIIDHEDGDVM